MSDLLKKAEMIYDYLQVKPWVKTYMTTKPMPDLAQRHVSALGFKTKKINKDMNINLEIKQDWRSLLLLSYYSMNLIPAFLLEGCLCTIIKVDMENGSIMDGQPIELDPLFMELQMFEELFRNEHMYAYEDYREIFMQAINFFSERRILEVSEDNKYVTIVKERCGTLINFFS